ncbi:MAG: FAD-dependent oxidoreductase [Chlamydiota bacterium]
MKNYDLTIIGNGIMGLSTALALCNKFPKFRIAIVGPWGNKNGASISSGAMLHCFSEVTTQTLATAPGQAKFALCHQALKKWPIWLESINNYLPDAKKLRIYPGTYLLLNNRSSELDTDNFFAIIEALNLYSEPFEEVLPKEIGEIDPVHDARPLRAIWVPGEGCISSHELLSSMTTILRKMDNVDFVNDHAENIDCKNGTCKSLILKTGEVIHSEKILLAAGAFSQALIDKMTDLRDSMPMVLSGVGYSILVEQNKNKPITHAIRTPNRAGACGLHVLPREGNSLYIGASNDLAFAPHKDPKMGMFNFLMECSLEQIDQKLCSSYMRGFSVGNRPATLDSFPLIGPSKIKNLFIMTGTYRDGFHQSPVMAQYMADLITNTEEDCTSPFFQYFKPHRELIQVKNKNDSIEEYVRHFQGSSYEHQLSLPIGILSDDDYLDIVRKKAEKLYDTLDIDYGLPPDVLFMFALEKQENASIKRTTNHVRKLGYKHAEPTAEKLIPNKEILHECSIG